MSKSTTPVNTIFTIFSNSFIDFSGLDAATAKFVKEDLFPAAIAYLQSFIKVFTGRFFNKDIL